MKILVYFIIAGGLFEIISNLCYLLKGKKKSIGFSAKSQYQKLSLELGYRHFNVKAIIVWMSLIVYSLPVIILFFLPENAIGATNETVFNHTINGQFVFPFILGSEPIKRLLVISFKDDPEYEMIEPQFYNDSIFGKGLRVLMYRTDKKIDVYYQSGVYFDSTDFALGKGLGNVSEIQMSPARFEISETGVDIDIVFTDYNGRKVELRIKENANNNKPLPFLAPVGNEVEKPSKLFLVYMHEFDFVKMEGTEIKAKVGERTLIPATFPIKREGKKVYFARYASKLTIGEINSASNGPLVFEQTSETHTEGIHNFSMNHAQKVSEYWIMHNNEKIKLSFVEGFPNLLSLPQNIKVKGQWNYDVSGTSITGGTYTLLRDNDNVRIEFNVTKKWKPQSLPFSLRAFTYFVRSFRAWPTTYQWEGSVNLKSLTLQGRWRRK